MAPAAHLCQGPMEGMLSASCQHGPPSDGMTQWVSGAYGSSLRVDSFAQIRGTDNMTTGSHKAGFERRTLLTCQGQGVRASVAFVVGTVSSWTSA